eukprot:6203726-Pleurochrysis_carterae.AAC.1
MSLLGATTMRETYDFGCGPRLRLPTVFRGGQATNSISLQQQQQGCLSALENPPVNPVVGPGPTTADVQRELHACQMNTVRASQPGETPAVYQSLHRVHKKIVHADALDPHIRFSTSEYVSLYATERFPGLLGG